MNNTFQSMSFGATATMDGGIFFPSAVITLNPNNVSSGIGTDGNDIFVTSTDSDFFRLGNWSGFALRGGAGTDALHLNASDVYDLRRLAEFSGIEEISFSDYGGDLYITSQMLADVNLIRGSGGALQARIYLEGAARQTFDLRGKAFSENYTFLTPASYADIIITDKSQILTETGTKLNFSMQAGARVYLVGDSFTNEEYARLVHDGVIFIRDDFENGASNPAPVVTGITGDHVRAHNLGVVAIDAGANGSVSDNVNLRKITVSVVNGDANDRIGLNNNLFDVPNGISEGGRLKDLSTFNGKVFANLYNVTNSSFEIYFNGEATQAHIDKVVHSLIYWNTGKAAQTQREIKITAYDAADKTATGTVTVTHTADVTAPPSGGGSVIGTPEPNVIKGGSGSDRLYGGAGDDTIYGGAGKDTINGETGKDVFVFDTRPAKGKQDTILSYKTRDDSIWLDNAVFTKLGKGSFEQPVKLSSKAFWTGNKAHDRDDRIIYDKNTGALYYDQDGTGMKAAVQFAKLDKNLKMTASEFFVV